MDQTASRLSAAVAFLFGVLGAPWPLAAQAPKARQAAAQPAAPAKAEKQSPAPKGGQAIAVLVNDEPITAYEIEQRAAFLANSEGGSAAELKAKAEARCAQITKDPKINERFQQLLREKNVRSREEAQALQAEFVKNLQHEMIEQLKRE